MTDVETTSEEGEVIITISDHIYIKTNMSPSETYLWLDRAKALILTGDFDQVESAE